jgi:hypothetical protein
MARFLAESADLAHAIFGKGGILQIAALTRFDEG